MCVTCVCYREEESLVDVFVIEMLVVLVHSLKMAHRDEKPLGMRSLPYIHTACHACALRQRIDDA